MFTGLVSEVGKIINIIPNQEGKIFTIHTDKLINEISLGDSVSVNGVCLTVFSKEASSFLRSSCTCNIAKNKFRQDRYS